MKNNRGCDTLKARILDFRFSEVLQAFPETKYYVSRSTERVRALCGRLTTQAPPPLDTPSPFQSPLHRQIKPWKRHYLPRMLV